MTQPIALHYWPTPNGWKVSIALEEMGLPYEPHFVNIGKGEQFTPEFLAISPNNRMPAIVDPEGPDGAPISVFESGAILQYLATKSGRFYGDGDARAQVAVDEWLFWQMGGLGPMAGQTHHFRQYAPSMFADSRATAYGAIRYTNETHRLYGVLNKRLEGRDFVADAYSIADMAIWPWTVPWKMQGIDLEEFPPPQGLARAHRCARGGAEGHEAGRGTAPPAAVLRQGGGGGPQGAVRAEGALATTACARSR